MIRLLTVILSLCIGMHVCAREVPEDWPAWLKDAMERESSTKAKAKFKIADEQISGRTKGKLIDKPQRIDDSWYFAFDVKAESEISCWVFPESVNTAASTVSIADNLIALQAEQNGGLNSQSIYTQDVYLIGSAPAMSLEWLVNMGGDHERKIGMIKVRSALVGDSSVICENTSVGYRDTFATSFEYLVNNLRVQRGADPYYESIHVLSLNDIAVGFSRATLSKDQDGDTVVSTIEATLVPVDATNVATSDSTTTEYSYPSGELINQYAYEVENNSVVVEAHMQFKEDGWVVSGTFQGKELEEQIRTEGTVWSSLGELQRTQSLVRSGKAGNLSIDMWIPGIDPLAMTSAEVSIGEDRTGMLVTGPITFAAEFDEFGDLQSGTGNVAGTLMKIESVYQSGSP
ncbi:MAG: hypothetical protein AAF541_15385 [Pseudomonadota bacterium]